MFKFRARIPVTVIGGFLGAGKTTLVNHLVRSGRYRYGVIVNEFGETGIDGSLIETLDEDGVAELENGCLCCVGRDDLLKALVKLAMRDEPQEYVLIELSGLADPVPVAQTILDPFVKGLFELDGIIGVADAYNLWQTVQECPEGSVQLAYTTTLILNKTDTVTPERLDAARTLARELSPLASLYEVNHGQVDPDHVLGQRAFTEAWQPTGHAHRHTQAVLSFTLHSETPLDRNGWNDFVNRFIVARPAQVYRTKGFVSIQGLEVPFLFQSVRDVINLDALSDQPLGPTTLVVIGRDLDETVYQAAFSQLQLTGYRR